MTWPTVFSKHIQTFLRRKLLEWHWNKKETSHSNLVGVGITWWILLNADTRGDTKRKDRKMPNSDSVSQGASINLGLMTYSYLQTYISEDNGIELDMHFFLKS